MMTGHTYTKLRESSKEVEVQWTEVFAGHMLLAAVQCSAPFTCCMHGV